jgi:hypothetical protein
MTQHWATPLIGKPWIPGATGPDAFYCWGLVQYVYRERLGFEFPHVEIEREGNNLKAIQTVARIVKMQRRAQHDPKEYDIVLMSGPFHRRHIGVIINDGGRLGVLHADGCMGPRGPQGSVMFHRISDAIANGYGQFEYWRGQ